MTKLPTATEEKGELIPNDWSPDGKKLAGWITNCTRAFVYSLETQTHEPFGERALSPRWLSDGRRLIFTDRMSLWLYDLERKEPQKILSVDGAGVSILFSVSRDDRWIYFSLNTQDGDLWLAELE
ncbi:MAG: PD40 domain-containing protein [Deltaproteobacteria bacterium]|nr:PD40 domain-containing protein [Deltaproteobacteria bacterium]